MVVLLVAVTICQLLIGQPARSTLGSLVRRFLTGSQLADSWRIMGLAIDYLRTGREAGLYETLFFDQQVKFQYPVSSLLFVWGLTHGALVVISQIAVALTACATWIILRRAVRDTAGADEPRGVLAFGCVALLTLLFYPVSEAFAIGQIQTWINAMFAWLIVAWLAGRERTAGVLLGLILLIKPALVPLLIWGALRRRYVFTAVAGGIGLAGTLAGIVLFGFDNTFGYVEVVQFIGARGEVFYPNQSWNGLLNRLFENGDALRFDRHAFAPSHTGVYVGTLMAAVATIGYALWRPTRSTVAGGAVDLAIMALTITMASPVAWDHHYGILLPISALVLPAVVAARPWGRATWPVVLVVYVLSAQTFYNLALLAGGASPANIVLSYGLFAAVGMLWLCYTALDALPITRIGTASSR